MERLFQKIDKICASHKMLNNMCSEVSSFFGVCFNFKWMTWRIRYSHIEFLGLDIFCCDDCEGGGGGGLGAGFERVSGVPWNDVLPRPQPACLRVCRQAGRATSLSAGRPAGPCIDTKIGWNFGCARRPTKIFSFKLWVLPEAQGTTPK